MSIFIDQSTILSRMQWWYVIVIAACHSMDRNTSLLSRRKKSQKMMIAMKIVRQALPYQIRSMQVVVILGNG